MTHRLGLFSCHIWLIDWLIAWLIDWPLDWLIDHLIYWPLDLLTNWLIHRLINWLIDQLLYWLTHCLTDWVTFCIPVLLPKETPALVCLFVSRHHRSPIYIFRAEVHLSQSACITRSHPPLVTMWWSGPVFTQMSKRNTTVFCLIIAPAHSLVRYQS